MAEVASKPTEPVPLDTIPISPEGSNTDVAGAADSAADQPVTVFHNSNEFNVKHALQNTWTLWFTKPPTGKVRSCCVVA